MNSADAAVSGVLLWLRSPQVLGAVLALLVAGVIALLVARMLRVRRARGAPAAPAPHPPHWLDHTLEGALILAPLVAALATLRSEEHTSELQSHVNLVCRLLL